ncbi:hypothetical protein ONS95_000746 [Cadophora gregata]|uniref:uncharacterized protein n=1 Tax=Cadophora gregata TaxID=51156 RepID=UPI0026DDABAC|nr:uncharacterized protein ONS95_000746 [Cadophora gregata]KAK0103076.1 hypothetical protein ONS96_005687 [Cadophora gregata f. sp. sojae]KAK0128796.1 hypothetical protein ONS95_000746 [Cadophora gregata]
MAGIRRNGNRDMSCRWTAGTQVADTIRGILEGLQGAASPVLACSDQGPQTKTQSLIPASIESTLPTSSTGVSAEPSKSTGQPSNQPLATPESSPSQSSTNSSPANVTPSPAAQTTVADVTILHLSYVSTTSLRTTPVTFTTSTSPEVFSLAPTSSQTSSPTSPKASNIALSASVPFSSLHISQPPKQTPLPTPPSAFPEIFEDSSGGSSQGLGSSTPSTSSTKNEVSSRAGLIIGGVIGGVIILAVLFTLYFCRRMKRKQHRRSLGYMSTAPMYKPWKKKEVERRNTMANLEGLLDVDRDRGNGRDGESLHAKPMRDRTVQFPTSASAFAYEGKGAASASSRPLTMPEQVFAPLRANRSSSLYSGSLLEGIELLPQTSPRRARAMSAHLPPTRSGFQDGNAIILNPFLTSSEMLQQNQRSTKAKRSPHRSDIYISRPYSVFDIAHDDFKGRQRDSAISGLSKFEDMHPLTPSPLTHSSNSQSRSRSRSRSVTSSYSRASTPALSPSRSKSPSASQFSRISSFATSTITKVQRALVTVRDLDKDVRLSLDVEQEYGYRLRDLGGRDSGDFTSQYKTADSNRKSNAGGSNFKKDVVMIVGEREVGLEDESDNAGRGGGLEAWDEREMQRRRKELEQAKMKAYKGRIRPGMGVQKKGGGAIGVERRWTGWGG